MSTVEEVPFPEPVLPVGGASIISESFRKFLAIVGSNAPRPGGLFFAVASRTASRPKHRRTDWASMCVLS